MKRGRCASSPRAWRICPTSTFRLPSTTNVSGQSRSVEVGLVEDPRPRLDQAPQQVERLGRQVALRLPAQQLARAWVDGERAEKDFHRFAQSLTNPYEFP